MLSPFIKKLENLVRGKAEWLIFAINHHCIDSFVFILGNVKRTFQIVYEFVPLYTEHLNPFHFVYKIIYGYFLIYALITDFFRKSFYRRAKLLN